MEVHPTLPLLLIAAAFLIAGLSVYSRLLSWLTANGGKVQTSEFGLPDLLISIVLSSFFAMLVLRAAMSHGGSIPKPISPEQVLPSAAIFLAMLAFILGFMRYRGIGLTRAFGLRRLSPWASIAIAAGLTLAAFPLLAATARWSKLLPQEAVQEQALVTLFREMVRRTDYAAISKIVLAGVIVAPVAEEVLFRGYFYGVFKRYIGAIPSALFTAALFASVHMNLASLPSLFVLGLCFTIAYEVTGSLAVSMGMHALFNGTELLLLYWQANLPP